MSHFGVKNFNYKTFVPVLGMEKYNVSPGECLAVGDSESDYSMYRAVNNFIAFNSDSKALLNQYFLLPQVQPFQIL